MAKNKFAVFILTHGRADHVITYRTLRRQGYTGDIYLIVDNEDDDLGSYLAQYEDQVIVFDKLAIAQTFDQGDNFNDRRAVIYARNASFQIAKDLGLDYFLQLDDDYRKFEFRFDASFAYCNLSIKSLDQLFNIVLEFYKAIPALSVCFAQTGDFIGGPDGQLGKKIWAKRKAMNTFFCATERPFQFFGRVNEDVNTYVTLGNRGGLFITVSSVVIGQQPTQHNTGGMSEMYLSEGTYWKTFYSVMYAPSCVKVSETGSRYRRIHHRISWNEAVPYILREEHQKTS